MRTFSKANNTTHPMKKITKREVVAFFLGIFTILLIDAALD